MVPVILLVADKTCFIVQYFCKNVYIWIRICSKNMLAYWTHHNILHSIEIYDEWNVSCLFMMFHRFVRIGSFTGKITTWTLNITTNTFEDKYNYGTEMFQLEFISVLFICLAGKHHVAIGYELVVRPHWLFVHANKPFYLHISATNVQKQLHCELFCFVFQRMQYFRLKFHRFWNALITITYFGPTFNIQVEGWTFICFSSWWITNWNKTLTRKLRTRRKFVSGTNGTSNYHWKLFNTQNCGMYESYQIKYYLWPGDIWAKAKYIFWVSLL